MSRNAIYKNGRLVALDGYIIPIRIGSYLLDSPDIPGLDPQNLCVGVDSLSGRLSFPGGNIETGEKIFFAGISECREETGSHRNPRLANGRILAFYGNSVRNRWAKTYDRTTHRFTVGGAYKLRFVVRTVSRERPVEQPPRHEETFPEFIKPMYRPLMSIDLPFLQTRPCFAYAISLAESHDMLYRNVRPDTARLDYTQLRADLTAMRLHPAIVNDYCDTTGTVPPWQFVLHDALYFDGLLGNLEKAEQERHALFTDRTNLHPNAAMLLKT